MIDDIKDSEIKYLKKELAASNRVRLHENLNIVAEMLGDMSAKMIEKDNEIRILKAQVAQLDAQVKLKLETLLDFDRQKEDWFKFFKDTELVNNEPVLRSICANLLSDYFKVMDNAKDRYWEDKVNGLERKLKLQKEGYQLLIDSKILENN
jgi:hypothetical protein